MKRFKHSLSHTVLSTFDMGELVPICNFEVLPGDSIRMATSALIRVSPLMAPVMHPVVVRIHVWYVPYRTLWDEWEDFITGGPDGLGAVMPQYPYTASEGDLADYIGVPPGAPVVVNAFPYQAYAKIWNEFYRDEDLQPEADWSSLALKKICWEKDYFTQARPWTQKGPQVSIPLGTTAPVIGAGTPLVSDPTRRPRFSSIDGTPLNSNVGMDTAGKLGIAAGTPASEVEWGDQTGLIANLGAASAAQINDLRRAMALQRYAEARAQYGHRYTEYLRFLGVRSSDGRLQRPEYLGGGKATISFSEVLRTATTEGTEAPVGDMSGHGIAGVRTRPFVRFFEEHGIVMALASVRPRTMYTQGLKREFSRTTREDFWQKELELIGQQPVRQKEIYAASATPNNTFGYQDRYSEYRHIQSYACGNFRSTLSDWHMGRIFGADPALNSAFVECQPSVRSFADQTDADKLWCMFAHSIPARRMVTKKTIGRII